MIRPIATDPIRQEVEKTYRLESRRVYATLVRLLGDFDLAEEAMHEAFASAVEQWRTEGVPDNPRSWLISTGRFKAIDAMRRRGRLEERQQELVRRYDEVVATNRARADEEIEDDRLRLIFTCCHPAIAPSVQVPLTLREICGLTTEEIASAFLTSSATMAQRIVRGKAKIREARIPYVVPSANELPERLEPVLAVVYLVFNEGYSASSGLHLTRGDLSGEAIRLGRLLVELLPEPEVIGLLALMLLQESRRSARATPDGDLILLEDQDRQLWDERLMMEGRALVERALVSGRAGPYSVQAAIAAVHSEARIASETDWNQIVALYDALWTINPSPVVELNRAVAIAMRDGPAVGLRIVDEILGRGELVDYHLAHATRAELNRRLGQVEAARIAYQQALSLTQQAPEQRFLSRRLQSL